MKKNDEGVWEYLSKYSKRKDKINVEFSESEVKYFSDNTIKTGVPWDVFMRIRDEFRNSPIVLYVSIDNKIIRVQYYNPEMNPCTKIWHNKTDFLCYAPQKEIR